VLVERVAKRQPALVAQSHHQDGREGLGDRPDAVLRVGVGRGAGRPGPGIEHAAPSPPRQPAVADDAGDERGQPALGLGTGSTGEQLGSSYFEHDGEPRTDG
jgi:hypothetical protein